MTCDRCDPPSLPATSPQIQSVPTGTQLVTLAAALRCCAEVEALAGRFSSLGIPLLLLKGPPLQHRLLGNEAAFRSADVDLLVHRRDARRARSALRAEGWDFEPANSLLWRIDRAAAFNRGIVTIDLHWGLHTTGLSPRRLLGLQEALWSGARQAPQGWWEPPIEPLVVYLALHAAGRGFVHAEQVGLLTAAVRGVKDWERVDSLVRTSWARWALDYAVQLSSGRTSHSGIPPSCGNWPAPNRLRTVLRDWLGSIGGINLLRLVRRGLRLSARHHLSAVRAAWWTATALRDVRRQLRAVGLRTVVNRPPRLRASAKGGVVRVLNRSHSTCLERALVWQKWLFMHDDHRAVVIGADVPDATLSGHAWVDGEEPASEAAFSEMLRLPPT